MKHVEIWSDGACSPNPGLGGWGAVLQLGKHKKELFGSEKETTNNRMEMTGALKALEALKTPCKVTLRTDSEYLCKAFQQNWYNKWANNDWKTSAGGDVKNLDLWHLLYTQDGKHQVEWTWVKGHSDDENNNRCDELAVQARLALKELSPEDKKKKVLGALKQALTRLRSAHKIAKEIDLGWEEDLIIIAKKNTSKLIRDYEP